MLHRIEQLNNIEPTEVDFSVLKNVNEKVLIEMEKVIQEVKNSLLKQAAKINNVEGIQYRNGGSDACDNIIKEFDKIRTNLYKQNDPRTGKPNN